MIIQGVITVQGVSVLEITSFLREKIDKYTFPGIDSSKRWCSMRYKPYGNYIIFVEPELKTDPN